MAKKNLQTRIEKSKRLQFVIVPGGSNGLLLACKGSDGATSYHIHLTKDIVTSTFADRELTHSVLQVSCQENMGYRYCNCKGNEQHTICYHGLGGLRHAIIEMAGKHISILEDIFEAISLKNMGGKLVKIVSMNGNAVLWGVVR